MKEELHCERPTPTPLVVACVVVLVGAQAGLTVWARLDSAQWSVWLDIAIAVLTTVLSPVLLWWPVSGALAFTVVALLSPVATPAAAIGALQVGRRRALRVALPVAVAGIAAHAVRGWWQPNGGISFGWWMLLITVAYGAILGWGAFAQSREALVLSLRERARRAEAEQGRRVAEARMAERNQMAYEMHDVLAHRLSLLATYAGALEYRPDAAPEQLTRAAGVIRGTVRQALEELREVINVLRLEDDAPGPQPTFSDIPRLVTESRDAGSTVELREDLAEPDSLPAAAGRTAYRIVREGLTNARKHAAGQPVHIALTGGPDEGLVIEVGNRLAGHAKSAVPGTGTGLVGLTERARLAGGRLDHEIAGDEFRLRAWLPWPA